MLNIGSLPDIADCCCYCTLLDFEIVVLRIIPRKPFKKVDENVEQKRSNCVQAKEVISPFKNMQQNKLFKRAL